MKTKGKISNNETLKNITFFINYKKDLELKQLIVTDFRIVYKEFKKLLEDKKVTLVAIRKEEKNRRRRR